VVLEIAHRDGSLSRAAHDVLIVGAGAAGLAAGRLLAEAGKRVALVEARTRVGGRIWTQHLASNAAPPFPVELGAEFVHGLPRTTWALIEEADLKSVELEGTQLCHVAGRLSAHAPQQHAAYVELERMTERWNAGQWQDRDFPFSEYLRHEVTDASTAEAAAAYVEGFNAADRHRISVGALARQQRAEDLIEGDRLFHVEGGYDAIPIFLADRFTRAGGSLLLGRRVHEVVWRRGAVALHARGPAGEGVELRADRALITVPLGVLQAGTIGFTPRPKEILTQAHRLVMGPVVRTTLIFKDRFWIEGNRSGKLRVLESELQQLSFLFSPADLPATWWTPMPRDFPMITGWVGGPKAAALRSEIASRADSPSLLKQCLNTLAKIFELPPVELEKRLLSCHAHDWQADEFTRGAYSYVPAGALDAPHRMTRPVENTLFFAGEHTDIEGHWGTVHAALQTGLRAAHQLLSADQ
jgi:monoamine oxidase